MTDTKTAEKPKMTFEMKKWGIAKRKMAWQVTGDRNIGGHTARIPDSFNFMAGPGPRGVGIDLSSRDKIEMLAETIIPQTTISKKSQLCMKMEDRWMYHHGGGRKVASPTIRRGRSIRSSRSSQVLDPVRCLFDKNRLRPDAIQELIKQLRVAAAVSNATNSLEKIAENPKPPGKRPMDSRESKKEDDDSSSEEFSDDKITDSSETLVEMEQALSPTPEQNASSPSQKQMLTSHKPIKSIPNQPNKILSKRKPLSANKTAKTNSATTKVKPVRSKSSKDRQSADSTKGSPSSQTRKGSDSARGEAKKGSMWGALGAAAGAAGGGGAGGAAKKVSPWAALGAGGGGTGGTKKGSLWKSMAPPMRQANKNQQSTTPDSGFQSDSPSFTNLIPQAKSQGQGPGAPNIKLASAMAELLRSARMMQMMKRRDSGNGEEAADSGGDRPEHALISMLEEVGKEEEALQGLYSYNPKMKKVFQVSNVVANLTGNRFIMPLTQNYELPGLSKDGQSFTRRRTRGLMYDTLEPIQYSHVYLKKSPNLQKKLGAKGKKGMLRG